MKRTIKILMYSFGGLFCGNAIVCTLLIIFKDRDYMRFWSYMGYIYFPFYDFILFLLPFATYLFVIKLFKQEKYLKSWDFFIIGLFIPLLDKLTDALKIANKMPWYFYVPVSFYFIALSYLLFKKLLRIK